MTVSLTSAETPSVDGRQYQHSCLTTTQLTGLTAFASLIRLVATLVKQSLDSMSSSKLACLMAYTIYGSICATLRSKGQIFASTLSLSCPVMLLPMHFSHKRVCYMIREVSALPQVVAMHADFQGIGYALADLACLYQGQEVPKRSDSRLWLALEALRGNEELPPTPVTGKHTHTLVLSVLFVGRCASTTHCTTRYNLCVSESCNVPCSVRGHVTCHACTYEVMH